MNCSTLRINKGHYHRKVISNHDIRSLLCFAIRELGSYKLIYKKELYRGQLALIVALAIIAGLLSIFACFCDYYLNSIIAITTSCIFITAAFVFGYNLRKRAKLERLNLQSLRMEMLKKYYSEKNYDIFQIEEICKLLKTKQGHLEKNAIYVLIIAGSLFLSVWASYVQQVVSNNSSAGFVGVAIFLIIRIIAILIILSILNPFVKLLRELNLNSFSQIYLIENLLYLTTHIIYEKRLYRLKKIVKCERKTYHLYRERRHRYGRNRRSRNG